MGEVASALADRVIITSDNPRTENPVGIIDQIRQGAGAGAECVIDRAAAISLAISEAGANDVVVLAGKGHEPYQETQGQRIPFSDLAQARAALRAWNGLEGQAG
jgi:UDP-N-acetylmuramoyl-L-alanyl-D-glutamate--2,6-diaminopimelate ligase